MRGGACVVIGLRSLLKKQIYMTKMVWYGKMTLYVI